MSIPWWGWLIIAHAGFTYALFEYIRKLTTRIEALERAGKP